MLLLTVNIDDHGTADAISIGKKCLTNPKNSIKQTNCRWTKHGDVFIGGNHHWNEKLIKHKQLG